MRKRSISITRECEENVVISFSRKFKTSTLTMCPDTIIWRQEFLRITCRICYNPLCQICYKPFFLLKTFSQILLFFKKENSNFPACSLIIIIVFWKLYVYGNGAKCPHVVPPRVSRNYETFCSLFARQTGEGRRQMSAATQQSNSLVIESLQN